MYNGYFGFREAPFSIAPDTSFFFACPSSQAALNTLLIAAKNGEGFIKITGEVGTGKTLLCRKFMATLDSGFVTAYISNPYLEPLSLLKAFSDLLEAPLEKDTDQYLIVKSINRRLLDLTRAGKRVLLCIDEAQAMPIESLEALRLLTNLETEKRKLLQIVLFGQPELDEKLQRDAIRQLTQRITFHYHLGPLTRDDLVFYLAHRLNVAGYAGSALFSPGAIRKLHASSGGIPRLVNILANKALMLTYGEGRQQVAARHVKAAAKDTVASRKGFRSWWLFAACTFMVAGISAAWTFLK